MKSSPSNLTLCSKRQIDSEDFVNFRGLFRKYELYLTSNFWTKSEITKCCAKHRIARALVAQVSQSFPQGKKCGTTTSNRYSTYQKSSGMQHLQSQVSRVTKLRSFIPRMMKTKIICLLFICTSTQCSKRGTKVTLKSSISGMIF